MFSVSYPSAQSYLWVRLVALSPRKELPFQVPVLWKLVSSNSCDFTLLLFMEVSDVLGAFIALLPHLPAVAMSVNSVYL